MELFLTRQSGKLQPCDYYWYHQFVQQQIQDRSREEFLKHMRSRLYEDDKELFVWEDVPRAAVKYMDINRFYSISGNKTWAPEIFNRVDIHEISRIIYWGAYNASISDEELVFDPLDQVEEGVKLLCDFALSRGYGIRISE